MPSEVFSVSKVSQIQNHTYLRLLVSYVPLHGLTIKKDDIRLLVTQISFRSKPAALMVSPDSFSVPYICHELWHIICTYLRGVNMTDTALQRLHALINGLLA